MKEGALYIGWGFRGLTFCVYGQIESKQRFGVHDRQYEARLACAVPRSRTTALTLLVSIERAPLKEPGVYLHPGETIFQLNYASLL